MASEPPFTLATRRRLLRDIAELQEKPYANIKLHLVDLTKACLILSPEGYRRLHLTVHLNDNYPLSAPWVTIQTRIHHPNVFGNYICASILNTSEGYTPAYTLKGICIQLLSFFGSDSIEQTGGGWSVDLKDFKHGNVGEQECRFQCPDCKFDSTRDTATTEDQPQSRRSRKRQRARQRAAALTEVSLPTQSPRTSSAAYIAGLPDELLLETLDHLDFEDLMSFSQAWPRVETLVQTYDLVRSRDLQCFVLKETYRRLLLGIGVSVVRGGTLQSEFDLISGRAFHQLKIRESVHGIPFQNWLPLPISYPHWRQVHPHIMRSLTQLAERMNLPNNIPKVKVVFAFMTDIVVRLNLDVEGQAPRSSQRNKEGQYFARKSTLRHASEKAIESYFHLYHLLLCLATGPGGKAVVEEANRMITSFMDGKRSKDHVPNLGHLLTALHISDVEVTVALRKAIITETITRNVVWLLDGKGAGFAELGFLEDDDISYYRLKKTFQGSRTSYRLLMFSELFRRTARPSSSTDSGKSLVEIRNELFTRHGGPPPGAAAKLASEVRRLQKIDEFPTFLQEMGLTAIPGAKNFTTVLRDTVRASVAKGYSCGGDQRRLLRLRISRDDEIDVDAAIEKFYGE
ncbi:ubiquitin-conjugating enzyme family protein [Pochonia chlamydosporia 170]|uniref:Ubiquitin-conjugating enzyme family protein n=1 Tax=Pochonia chlamydosporia 170 TaxID=1380566 RepID=A0A179G5H8_METCM|nr:ubiquitin-conjugating enzyme family protein [Pochonia chlamydosporia 170]OAQ73077.2 ubiquitin-conjugating enzyme family protein [Pochonia chlamydosporia 170]